jgi:hypothetical protein
MGFTEEADAYMDFISERFRKSRSKEGALPIMVRVLEFLSSYSKLFQEWRGGSPPNISLLLNQDELFSLYSEGQY